MKKHLTSLCAILLALLTLFLFVACTGEENTNVWETALYHNDTTLGEGKTTLVIEVEALGHKVTFTIMTDKTTVGEAMLEHGLIAGDQGSFGLYVKTVNGILADYNKNKHYWAFYIDEKDAYTGVDFTEITEGAKYQLVYT